MRLLFDENLSRTLVLRLNDIFPDSDHVVLLGLEHTPDAEIFRYARENDHIIVTKDSDFNDLVSISADPPGLVWIRAGNCTTRNVEHLL
ncbi:DUF5615 family PIN-like protein [soil metagenome]